MEPAPIAKMVALRVRRLRTQRSWSAQRLAEECANAGVPALTRGTIAKIESGVRKSVSAEEVAVLARVFGVTPTDLLAPESSSAEDIDPAAPPVIRAPDRQSAIMVVDVEPFADPADSDRIAAHDHLYSLLRRSFDESDISWTASAVTDRGDGALILLPPDVPKVALVDQLPHRLIAALRRYNAVRAVTGRIRLRVAVHVGDVRDDETGAPADDIAVATRLADAAAVRGALRESAGTLALVVSDHWYREVVSGDPAAEPRSYLRVDAPGGDTVITGWLRLPDAPGADPPPSGHLEPFRREQPTTPAPAEPKLGSLAPLIDALTAVPVLRDAAGRQLALRMLTRRIGSTFAVRDHPVARMHLLATVLACEEHPDGLNVLADVLAELEGESAAIARVRAAVDDLSVHELIPARARQRLLDLLPAGRWPDLAEVYRSAAGPYAPDIPADADPATLFATLEQMNARPDGLPPVLLFVAQLAARSDPHLARELRDWNHKQAENMGVSHVLRAAEHAAEFVRPAWTTVDAYLVIGLQSDALDAAHFVLRHWRQLGDEWRPMRGEDVVCTLPEVQRRVADLVADAESGWAANARMIRLEFLLPQELLNLPVDQWPSDVDEAPTRPLGLRYQIVVRSIERMRNPKWHRVWRRRWHTFLEWSTESRSKGELALWATADQPRELRVLDATLARNETLASLVFHECPELSDVGMAMLTVGLRAGMPVMLWRRTDRVSGDFDAEMRDLLADNHDIRESARILRGRAFSADDPETHVGSHLTLLWDDPSRLIETTGPPSRP